MSVFMIACATEILNCFPFLSKMFSCLVAVGTR
jgi:hypothetical protein